MLKLVAAETGTVSSRPLGALDPTVEVWRDNAGDVCAYGFAEDDRRWMVFPGLASFRIDTARNEVAVIADPALPDEIIQDTFERSVLPMALQARGQQVLHASAVLMPCGVVALCAASETGKSTLACGLSRRGHLLWADDAVAFEAVRGAVRAVPLPFRLRLRRTSAAYFEDGDEVEPAPRTPAGARGAGSSKPQSSALAAVFVLGREQRDPAEDAGAVVCCSRLSPREAFTAILPHAYCFEMRYTEAKRQMMGQYLDLATQTPVFALHFQTGLENVPAVLDAI